MTKSAKDPTHRKKEKHAWEPPRIKTGQLFESNSLSCGKSNMMMEPCIMNPQAS